jgi:hypothetical protein
MVAFNKAKEAEKTPLAVLAQELQYLSQPVLTHTGREERTVAIKCEYCTERATL